MDTHKEYNTVKKIDRRGVLPDGDVIKVQTEGEISIDDNDIPVPENILVPEAPA